MAEYDTVMRILMSNANKNFVQRIIQPNAFPELDLGNGMKATHKMAWTEENGRYFVHPTILYDGKELKDWGDKAFEQAKKTGDVLEFQSPQAADWFSKRYKVAWGQ
jgi:hypothetical protein